MLFLVNIPKALIDEGCLKFTSFLLKFCLARVGNKPQDKSA